ncbi:MAG TPA: hypothetical protein VNZ26_17940 [Vicinamibacterales bacterium]|nr:hypothetical protein [Vicinamibacterales bacterium]
MLVLPGRVILATVLISAGAVSSTAAALDEIVVVGCASRSSEGMTPTGVPLDFGGGHRSSGASSAKASVPVTSAHSSIADKSSVGSNSAKASTPVQSSAGAVSGPRTASVMSAKGSVPVPRKAPCDSLPQG